MSTFSCVLIALLLCVVANAQTGSHSAAQIFNGALYYVNTSTLTDGVWVNTGAGKIGNIVYAPAFQGALYGNMSVSYGHNLPSTSDCTTVLNDFSGYTGGYTVFPEENPPYIEHYPIVSSNPISGHTQAGIVARRYYSTYDNDNLVSLGQDVTTSNLYWYRDFPFPPPPTCTLAASVAVSGASWLSGGYTFQQYTLTVTNVGEVAATSAEVVINLGGSATIDSSWNLAQVSGTTYTVSLYSGLAVGAQQSSSGFIVKGSGTVSVAVIPTNVVCN